MPGELLTFDYTLNEWEMSTPFTCLSTGRNAKGFQYLTEEEQQRAMPHAWAHVRQMFDKHHGLSPLASGLRRAGEGSYSRLQGSEA